MRSLTLATFLTIGSGLAYAQSESGAITGTVVDPFSHPFANATVQARNTANATAYKGASKTSGEYTITGLPAGTYDVSTAIPAVKFWEKKGLVVEAGKTLSVKIQLEESTQLSTLGEDPLGAIADQKRHAPPAGPAPRTIDGKPDLSGVWWRFNDVDPGKPEWLPSADAEAKRRLAMNSKESPQAYCLPSPVTRWGPLFQFAQSRNAVVVINDDESPGFHQFRLDRAQHPSELDTDLWYGDNIAHWDGDTLVVDRVGFHERVWLDQAAHPHSDKLHVIERYRRPDLGHMEQEVTVEDPGVLAKPWVIKRVSELAANESIREFICAENNRDVVHMVGK